MIRTVVIASALTAALSGCSTNGGDGNPLIDAFKNAPVNNLLGGYDTARDLDAVCPQVSMELLVPRFVDQLREDRPSEVDDLTLSARSRGARTTGDAFMAAGGMSYDLKGTPRDQWDTARVCPAAATAAGSDTLIGLMLVAG